eukprot:SAG22_NODE_77_length_22125_cov_46.140016_14_plen_78_part_00
MPVLQGLAEYKGGHWAADARKRLEELREILQGLSDEAGGSDYADAEAYVKENVGARAAAKAENASKWELLIEAYGEE